MSVNDEQTKNLEEGVVVNECATDLVVPSEEAKKAKIMGVAKKVGKVAIEFMPAFDEARFVYVCPAPLFEQSTAMLAIKESIASFTFIT